LSQDSLSKERPQSITKSSSEINHPSSSSPSEGVLVYRWKHVQSLVRLTQMIHVLSDVITDWEVIVDSFEQLMVLLLTALTTASSQPSSLTTVPNGSNVPQKSNLPLSGASGNVTATGTVAIHEELTPMDVERIFECIERFKGYSVFLSDESLMRLMTSLVALSLNPLAASLSSNQQMTNGNITPIGRLPSPRPSSLHSW
jgi:hypothetical protein